jgi:hypothetical protein
MTNGFSEQVSACEADSSLLVKKYSSLWDPKSHIRFNKNRSLEYIVLWLKTIHILTLLW